MPRLKLDNPVYTKKQRWPKFNVEISPSLAVSLGSTAVGGRLLRQRLPNWTIADHRATAKRFRREAIRLKKEWSKEVNLAANETWGRGWKVSDYKVSGIGSSEFSQKRKTWLRELIKMANEFSDLALAHEAAARNMRGTKSESALGSLVSLLSETIQAMIAQKSREK